MVTWNITYHDLWISGGGVVYWLMLWLHSTKIILTPGPVSIWMI